MAHGQREFEVSSKESYLLAVLQWAAVIWLALFSVLGVLVSAALALDALGVVVLPTSIFPEDRARGTLVAAKFLAGCLFWCALALPMLWEIKTSLVRRRCRVLIDDDRMVATDWRGRQTTVLWPEVSNVRIERITDHYGNTRTLSATCTAQDRTVNWLHWLDDHDVLAGEIVARANLTMLACRKKRVRGLLWARAGHHVEIEEDWGRAARSPSHTPGA